MDKEIENLIEEARDETNLGGPKTIFTYLQKYHKDAKITRADIQEYMEKQGRRWANLEKTKYKKNKFRAYWLWLVIF